MGGDIYERELKGILSGEVKVIERIVRTLSPQERSAYRTLLSKHFLVVRAGGSMGVDLLAVRGDFAFPIEVKSSTEEVLRFSRSEKLRVQAERLKNVCEHARLVPTYAYRLKNAGDDPWRLFTIPDMRIRQEGIPWLLFRRLPKMDVTGEGNSIMRWSEGMKLSRFIDYFMNLEAPLHYNMD